MIFSPLPPSPSAASFRVEESKKFDEVYSASSAMDGFRVAGMKAGALVLQSENLKPRGSLKTDEPLIEIDLLGTFDQPRVENRLSRARWKWNIFYNEVF